jgi:hypothetical protein
VSNNLKGLSLGRIIANGGRKLESVVFFFFFLLAG